MNGWSHKNWAGSAGRDERKLNTAVAAAAVEPSSLISILALCTASSSCTLPSSKKPLKSADESNRLPRPSFFKICHQGGGKGINIRVIRIYSLWQKKRKKLIAKFLPAPIHMFSRTKFSEKRAQPHVEFHRRVLPPAALASSVWANLQRHSERMVATAQPLIYRCHLRPNMGSLNWCSSIFHWRLNDRKQNNELALKLELSRMESAA